MAQDGRIISRAHQILGVQKNKVTCRAALRRLAYLPVPWHTVGGAVHSPGADDVIRKVVTRLGVHPQPTTILKKVRIFCSMKYNNP